MLSIDFILSKLKEKKGYNLSEDSIKDKDLNTAVRLYNNMCVVRGLNDHIDLSTGIISINDVYIKQASLTTCVCNARDYYSVNQNNAWKQNMSTTTDTTPDTRQTCTCNAKCTSYSCSCNKVFGSRWKNCSCRNVPVWSCTCNGNIICTCNTRTTCTCNSVCTCNSICNCNQICDCNAKNDFQ